MLIQRLKDVSRWCARWVKGTDLRSTLFSRILYVDIEGQAQWQQTGTNCKAYKIRGVNILKMKQIFRRIQLTQQRFRIKNEVPVNIVTSKGAQASSEKIYLIRCVAIEDSHQTLAESDQRIFCVFVDN